MEDECETECAHYESFDLNAARGQNCHHHPKNNESKDHETALREKVNNLIPFYIEVKAEPIVHDFKGNWNKLHEDDSEHPYKK